MSQHIGYIRVSSVDQNIDRQLKDVELDKVFTDKCSGKDTNRPELLQLIEYARDGDYIHVHDISRMARNTEDLLRLVKSFTSKGITLKFHKEHLEFTGVSNPMQDLMLTMLGGIYQFERAMILERQREGIAIAKSKGRYKGKQPNKKLHADIHQLFSEGTNKAQIARSLGCTRQTVIAVLKR
ncbi:recombinase family protein [Shewanella olleyana]|uniref:recombinase family protein n=1 Tax=Shewanella olleyana TaxID=135626 RepID=UPI0024B22754|nr:recombinase family protein [Shewanella olleyana]